MTVKYVTGDLFSLDVDAIGHGVNCKGLMGAGIAAQFRDRFPVMYRCYYQLCNNELLQLGQVFVWKERYKGSSFFKNIIYNIASQFEPGANANLEALLIGVNYVEYHARTSGLKTVGIPQIGAGLGGLNWADVSEALEILLDSSPVEFQLVTYG